jgi:hypothetical protein
MTTSVAQASIEQEALNHKGQRRISISLCNLGVLCVSVVNKAIKIHHGDTESTKDAQRSVPTRTVILVGLRARG